MTGPALLATVVMLTCVGGVRFLVGRTFGWGSIRPYKRAHVEGRTVVLPGRRGQALVELVLVVATSIFFGVVPWMHPGTPLVVSVAMVIYAALLAVLCLGALASFLRPDVLRFDDEHVEVASWSTDVRIPWDEVFRVGPALSQMEIICHEPVPDAYCTRRPRVAMTSRVKDNIIFVPPTRVHRPWVVLRLLNDLALLDRQGRAEMIDEVVLPVLTVKASTQEGLTRRYQEIARIDDRVNAYVRRKVHRW